MKQSIRQNWQIVLILFFALIVRVPLLNGSFWLDEAAQVLESSRPLAQQLSISDDFQPPLIHIIVHFLLFFSSNEAWLRLGAALIPGLITIWCVYEIGKQVKNKSVGVLSALLLTTSSFHIYFSQELRPYSLPAMCASLTWLLLITLSRSGKNSKKIWFLFTLLTILGLYSSYIYPFLLLSQSIYIYFFLKKQTKELCISIFFSFLAFLPWLPSFFSQLHSGQTLRLQLSGWDAVVGTQQAKALALTAGKFLFGVLSLKNALPFVLFTLLLLLLIVPILSAVRKRKEVIFLSLWLFVPILTAWCVSFFVPILQPKRVLFCLPAFFLLLGILFSTGLESKSKLLQKSAFIVIVLFFVMNFYSLFKYYTTPKYQREDWRSLHAEILQKYPASQSIAVFSFTAPFAPWVWYDDGKYPTFSTGVLDMQKISDISVLRKVSEYRFVLVFDYLRDLTDPKNSILSELQKYGYQEIDEIVPATQIGFVRVFARKKSVIGTL